MSEAQRTTDHQVIRKWVEERGGFPATVKQTTEADEPGILRIDFPDYGDEAALQRIDWEEFFEKFDKENLAFLFQEETEEGQTSRFSKFVSRE